MRRFLLPALMMTLLLTGCGGAAPERRMEELKQNLSDADSISLTAEVTATLEHEVFACTLDCTAKPDAVTVIVRAPESIAGIRAVVDASGSVSIRSEAVMAYSPRCAAQRSPARPWRCTPAQTAGRRGSCPSIAARIPVSASPLPPFAMPGLPCVVM